MIMKYGIVIGILWKCFLRMSTQWSTSFGGYVGLKYEVLLLQGGLFDLYQVKDREKNVRRIKNHGVCCS